MNVASWHHREAQVVAVLLAAVASGALAEGPPPGGTVAVRPGEVSWKPDPRAAGIELAVVSGDPKAAGPYVLRVRMARDARLPPHRHPDVRFVTVLSGEFHMGLGEVFDEAATVAYPAGSLIVIPANTPHFGWARTGECVTQDNGWGPTGSAPAGASAR